MLAAPTLHLRLQLQTPWTRGPALHGQGPALEHGSPLHSSTAARAFSTNTSRASPPLVPRWLNLGCREPRPTPKFSVLPDWPQRPSLWSRVRAGSQAGSQVTAQPWHRSATTGGRLQPASHRPRESRLCPLLQAQALSLELWLLSFPS